MAEGMYKRAIENDSTQSLAYILLANLYTNHNKVKEAIEVYKQALRVDQNNAEIYCLLGNAHYLDNDVEKAIMSYRASITLEPTNDEYRLIYSQVVEDYMKTIREGANA